MIKKIISCITICLCATNIQGMLNGMKQNVPAHINAPKTNHIAKALYAALGLNSYARLGLISPAYFFAKKNDDVVAELWQKISDPELISKILTLITPNTANKLSIGGKTFLWDRALNSKEIAFLEKTKDIINLDFNQSHLEQKIKDSDYRDWDQHYLKASYEQEFDFNRAYFNPETCRYMDKLPGYGYTEEGLKYKPQKIFFLKQALMNRLGKNSYLLYTTNHTDCEIIGQNNPRSSTATISFFKNSNNEQFTGEVSTNKINSIALHHASITCMSSTKASGFLSHMLLREQLNLYTIDNNGIIPNNSFRTWHAFKRLTFITKKIILGLTTDGDIYTIALDDAGKQIQSLHRQRLYTKDRQPITIVDFAHDAKDQGKLILVGGAKHLIPFKSVFSWPPVVNRIEYKPEFYYVNLRQSDAQTNRITMINISELFINPCAHKPCAHKRMQGIEKLWLHDGTLGVVYGKGVNIENCEIERLSSFGSRSSEPGQHGSYQKLAIGTFNCIQTITTATKTS